MDFIIGGVSHDCRARQCDWQLVMSLPSRGIIHSWLSAFEKVESSP